jgi:hypothetical protein
VWSQQSPVEGFADRDSVSPGQPVRLFLHAVHGPVTVRAFRIGWYGGTGGHLVWASAPVPQAALDQPHPEFIPATKTVSAGNWKPSLNVDTHGWVPGDYLFTLTDARGAVRWVRLTVRSPSMKGAIVILNSTTTSQAYNAFGGYSLYAGPNGAYATRSYAVSFDRPYDFGAGAGDFFGNERPLVMLAEKLNLPLAYATDTDLDADPNLLNGAIALISLGHDEYWSQGMRDAVMKARDHAGMNVAFLGANAIYRHIRLEPTPLGPERLEVDYKDGTLDPLYRTDAAQATFQWRSGPDPRPESVLTGAYYQCNPVTADLVVADPTAWLFGNTGVKAGTHLKGLAGSEYDQAVASAPGPRPLQVLFHSPVHCAGQAGFADVVYYSVPSGAGGFDAGTSSWVCAILGNQCGPGRGSLEATAVVTQVTTNLLQSFAAGPAGRTHPAHTP